jgi:hypothetical protein
LLSMGMPNRGRGNRPGNRRILKIASERELDRDKHPARGHVQLISTSHAADFVLETTAPALDWRGDRRVTRR